MWISSHWTRTPRATALAHVIAECAHHPYHSMNTRIQNQPWLTWMVASMGELPVYTLGMSDLNCLSFDEKKRRTFQRSLFITHGMELPITRDDDVDLWLHRKAQPWNAHVPDRLQAYTQEHIIMDIYTPVRSKVKSQIKRMKDYTFKSMDGKHWYVVFPKTQSRFQLANAMVSWNLLTESVSWTFPTNPVSGFRRDPEKSPYTCFVDTGTHFQHSVMLDPTQCQLSNIAYVITDRLGTVVHQHMLRLPPNEHPSKQWMINLFFLDWGYLLTTYQARIAAYNGAFDLTVLQTYPYTPINQLLQNAWSHDVMYMVKNATKSSRCLSLAKAYELLVGDPSKYQWHHSMDDCLATKELYFKVLSQFPS